MKLGQAIVEIRKKNELTQEEFAKEFCVTRQTVSNWENGKSYPDLVTLIKISDTYGFSLDYMLKEDKDMTEAMNKSIQLGREAKERQKKNLYFGLVGCIACLLMSGVTFMDGGSTLVIVAWGFCALLNVPSVLEGLKAYRQTELNIKPMEQADVDMVKQLLQRDMRPAAIKVVRKKTGLGLVEATALVDEIKNS